MKKLIKKTVNSVRSAAIRLAATRRSGEGYIDTAVKILIAVVLGSPTSADRFETAKALLNYGFAGYSLVTVAPSEPISPIPVTLGTADSVQPVLTQESQILLPKAEAGKVSTTLSLPDTLQAPVEKGQELGSLTVLVDGKENQKLPLVAQEEVPRLTLWAVYQSLLGTLFCGT